MTRTKDGAADGTTLLSTWTDKLNVVSSTIQGLLLLHVHNTYNLSLVGVYSINIRYTAFGGVITNVPYTFTIVDPCIAAVVPPTTPDYTKFTTDPNFS